MFPLLFFYLNLLCCSFHFAHFFFFAFWLFFLLVIYCRVVFSTYVLIQRTDVSVDYEETLISTATLERAKYGSSRESRVLPPTRVSSSSWMVNRDQGFC